MLLASCRASTQFSGRCYRYLLLFNNRLVLICILNNEVLLLWLRVVIEMCLLLVQEATNLLVLLFIQNPQKKLFQIVLTHDCVLKAHKRPLSRGSDILTCILEVVSQLANQFVGIFEKQNVITQLWDQLLKASADAQTVDVVLWVDILGKDHAQDFRVRAIVCHGYECHHSFVWDKYARVAPLFEEDLNEWIQIGLHAPFKELEHISYGDQSHLWEAGPQWVCKLSKLLNQAVQCCSMLKYQVLMVLADPSYYVASLELDVPISPTH